MKTNDNRNKALELNRRIQLHGKVLELFKNASELFESVSLLRFRKKGLDKINGADSLFAIKEAAWVHLVWFFEQYNNYQPYHRGYILDIAKKKSYKPYDRRKIKRDFVEACKNLNNMFNNK